MKLPFHDKKFLFLFFAVLLAVTLEILSLTGIEIPMPYAPFAYALFILATGYKVLLSGLKSLFHFNFSDINLLMLIAVTAAFYLGEYPEAAVVIVLYILGENLEDIGLERSMSALDRLVVNSPRVAFLKDREDPVAIGEVAVGSVIQVKPFDMIPLDGIVESGSTSVDESAITGEPLPREKFAGEAVFAGTLNKSGSIEIRTTRRAEDTTYARIIELTYHAQKNRSEAQNFIQKFARIYTPVVIVLSVALFCLPVLIFGEDPFHWLNQAISILVISCPCALVISTPVAIYAAIGNASEKGVLVKGGKYLEALAQIRAVALDKTRTITYGNPVVSDVIPLNGASSEELLACGAGTELFSEHPLARAIVDRSLKEGFNPHEISNFESVIGQGARSLCITCGEAPVWVGKSNFAETDPIRREELRAIVDKLSEEGKTSVVVSCGHEVKGVLGLTDEVKPDSAGAIAQLLELGVEPVMLTGDNRQAGEYVAGQVGIKGVYAGLLPEEKAKVVRELKEKYAFVAMTGDGVNDAPALAESTVGVAMAAAGSDTAIEVSDIALMNDKLSLLPFLVRLSRKTVATIRWNTIGAILVKVLFILLAFCGYGNLVLAISADVGVMVVVVLISLRLMSYNR